jgi:uncharacterized membrane protein
MNKERLSAYTDAVMAVIVTIMVLELKPPHGADLASLAASAPLFFSYVLSFVYVSIYWANHHHFFQLVDEVDGAVLWANLHLLFWLSLVPFTTAWMGEHPTAPIPVAVYGVSLLMPAIAWLIMQATIIHRQGKGSRLKAMIGDDLKGKLSTAIYLAGIIAAFVNTWIADAFYLAVLLMWLIPDRRVERMLEARG